MHCGITSTTAPTSFDILRREHYNVLMAIIRVESPKFLYPSLERGAKAAVYEAPVIFRPGQLKPLAADRFAVMCAIDEAIVGRSTNAEVAQRFLHVKPGIKNKFGNETAENFEKIGVDIASVTREIPNHRFGASWVLTQRPQESAPRWHKDSPGGPIDLKELRLVRTYDGPSTQYADDLSGNGKREFKSGAVALHKNGVDGAVHRSPQTDQDRFAVSLVLRKL